MRLCIRLKYPIYRSWLNYSFIGFCFSADDDLIRLASSYKASGGRQISGSSIATRIRSTEQNKLKFVFAFCQSNCGDVSPNVLGAFCTDTNRPCDFNHSTCNGQNELCYGRGPGYSSACIQIITVEAFIFLFTFGRTHYRLIL